MTNNGHDTHGAIGVNGLPVRVGDLLRHYRDARRLTQAALEERSTVSWHTISALERGRERPRPDTIGLLEEALGLSDDERAALAAAVVAAGGATGRRMHNLPHALTASVGREVEVEAVRRLVGEHRLVTLTGTGGVGKTRLAVEAAHRLLSGTPDGVWMAELAPVADPALLPQTVATAIGIKGDLGNNPLATLQAALRSRRLVLLLDNCEHVVEACAEVADALTRACPHVRVLATSRELLNVVGELAWRVPSFEVPPPMPSDAASESLLRYDSVRLFVDRAATGAPGFALTPGNARAVAEVCRRLDGIPLALELAASRVRGLSIEQLAARLDDRFRLLTGGSRTALPRQQTLRAAVDWSYDLLSAEERTLFRRLSVFAGSFTLQAAEAICADGPEVPRVLADAEIASGTGRVGAHETTAEPEGGQLEDGSQIHARDVHDLLLRLVDRSLVISESGDEGEAASSTRGGEHFRLLESLREYGRERLLSFPEAERIQRLHLAFYLGLAEQSMDTVDESPMPPVQRTLGSDVERKNLWAALRWANDTADPEGDARLRGLLGRLVLRLVATGLSNAVAPLLFELRRLRVPAYAHLERTILQRTDVTVLDGGANLYHIIGDWTAEVAVLQRWLEAEPDELASARVQLRYARLLLIRQNIREATALLDAVARIAEARGDDLLLLDALQMQGFSCVQVGDCHGGREKYARALALLEQLRPKLSDDVYRSKRLVGLHGSGCVAHNADDNAVGEANHMAAARLAQQQHDRPQEVLNRLNAADAQWGCWRYGEALQTYREVEEAATDAGYPEGLEFCLLGRGIVLWSIGRYSEATDVLRKGLIVARDLGDIWGEAYGLTYLSNVQACCGDLQTARGLNREASDLAQGLGAEYLLALAELYRFWLQEVEAPGGAALAPHIDVARERARRLGLDGIALHLSWVHLLHRAAYPAVPDASVAEEVALYVRAFPLDRPARGLWEILGLQLARTLRSHRPHIDRTDLERLVAQVIDQKASSLMPTEQTTFRETRRCLEVRGWSAA